MKKLNPVEEELRQGGCVMRVELVFRHGIWLTVYHWTDPYGASFGGWWTNVAKKWLIATELWSREW